jgi:glycosyltransferase involved in cell wall biosynthesis
MRIGKWNCLITAGIETTIAPKNWIDGCNRMDLVITTSNFSKDVLMNTKYAEIEKVNGRQIREYNITKPIKVLFEGVDRKIYNNKTNPNFDLNFENPFCFLFVGHWLKGDLGQDRKNVGLMIKLFAEQFSNTEKQPALILKTSSLGFSIKERESLKKKIQKIVEDFENPPPIYLLFGDLTDEEMNSLYNHPNIKAMISLTKGEGFGRPLLEFTMTGKPVIASNWSGQKDFLSDKNSTLLGGTLTDVDESAIDNFIIKESKWFSVDNNEAKEAMKMIFEKYEDFKKMSEQLRIENENKFGINEMTSVFKSYLEPHINKTPIITKLNLPKLTKIN